MANQQPVKIIELTGSNWMGGIAIQPNLGIGGLFRQASNFDPFERAGIYRNSIAATQRGAGIASGAGNPTNGARVTVGVTISGVSYFYAFGDGSKVYRVQTSDGTTTDQSAQISGMATMQGGIKFKNTIVYACDDNLRANALTLAIGSQVGILSLSTPGYIPGHKMMIGADRNLYVINGTSTGLSNSIARITSVTGTTGNSASYLSFDTDVVIKDLENDGQYLVILGDSGGTSNQTGRSRCFVAFWNMKSQDLSRIWEFEDNYVTGMKCLEDEIIVFGEDNMYSCNFDTRIHPIMPFKGASNLLAANPSYGGNSAIIRKSSGIVLWAYQGQVYGYGRTHPDMKKIFFNPYSVGSGNIRALFADGNTVWATTDEPAIYDFSLGSRNATSLIYLEDIDFKTPYRFAYAKVILKDALISGQTIDLQINTQNGSKLIQLSNGFDFATYGGLSSHIFYPKVNANSSDVYMFEDMTTCTITNTNGVAVRRLEIWAYPIDPSQTVGY